MTPPYFSEQELGPRPRTHEEITAAPWGGIVALIWSRITDGSFGFRYGVECPDGQGIYGVDTHNFSLALTAEVPEIPWPLDPNTLPPTLAILDLIQFCYQAVAEPIKVSGHAFFGHWHLNFDQEQGRETFRNDVNRIFSRNGIAYELIADGNIVRIGPELLRDELGKAVFHTGDNELDRMLETARKKFLDPDLNVRKEALEKLWDAWERIKTLEIPGEGDKKASVTQLLNKAASEPKFREVLEDEAIELTAIGNDFQIRHTEIYKTPIEQSEHVDFLFHRLFAMTRLVLRTSGRGG
ncbi:MAG: AbiJ-NTD4 domain-containing protein [Nitrospiraceae bacterium]